MPGIHHCAIVTADLERSKRFWCDGLGLTQLFDHTFTGDWPTLFNARTDRLRSIFLGDPESPDTGIVELVQFEDTGPGAPPFPVRAGGSGPAPGAWCLPHPGQRPLPSSPGHGTHTE